MASAECRDAKSQSGGCASIITDEACALPRGLFLFGLVLVVLGVRLGSLLEVLRMRHRFVSNLRMGRKFLIEPRVLSQIFGIIDELRIFRKLLLDLRMVRQVTIALIEISVVPSQRAAIRTIHHAGRISGGGLLNTWVVVHVVLHLRMLRQPRWVVHQRRIIVQLIGNRRMICHVVVDLFGFLSTWLRLRWGRRICLGQAGTSPNSHSNHDRERKTQRVFQGSTVHGDLLPLLGVHFCPISKPVSKPEVADLNQGRESTQPESAATKGVKYDSGSNHPGRNRLAGSDTLPATPPEAKKTAPVLGPGPMVLAKSRGS